MRESLGLKYLAAALREPLERFLAAGDLTPLLRTPAEERAFHFIRTHVLRHGKLPKPATVAQQADTPMERQREPASYYLDNLKLRRIDRTLRGLVDDASEKLNADKDPRAALDMLSTGALELIRADRIQEVSDLRQAQEPVLEEHELRQQGVLQGVLLGWPYIDEQMGGMGKGDLTSLVGRPEKGKTWLLVHAAHHAWHVQKKRVLVVSMEMAVPQMRRRFAALHAKVPAMALKLGQLGDPWKRKLRTALRRIETADNPLYIVDGNLALEVNQLLRLVHQLQPDVVYVDGAYLMRVEDKSLQRFRRIDEVAEQLKSDVSPLAPTLATWQFRREQGSSKRRKDVEPTLDDIYGSDVIAQASSVVLGILAEEETPETLLCKVVSLEKGREGEKGRFRVHWDFETMRFDQLVQRRQEKPEDAEEAQYL